MINTVFASIAVLPVFLVWFLGIITDSIEEKENHGDRVIILEENDTEELEESEYKDDFEDDEDEDEDDWSDDSPHSTLTSRSDNYQYAR